MEKSYFAFVPVLVELNNLFTLTKSKYKHTEKCYYIANTEKNDFLSIEKPTWKHTHGPCWT
jgi:hypothetical protein